MTLKADPEKIKAWQQRSRQHAADQRHARTVATGKFHSARRRINRAGPKTTEWERVRRWLKIQFDKVGIRTCQLKFAGCWFDNALSFCHVAKRRNLLEGEIYVVALGCIPCHNQLEVMSPEDMRRIVEGLFAVTGIEIPK